MKTISIPLRAPSAKSSYACPDGEIDRADNFLTIASPSLSPGDGADNNPAGGDNGGGNGGAGGASAAFTLTLPPPPAVEFALRKGVLRGWHDHPDRLPARTVEKGEASPSGWGKKAALLLASFHKDLKRRGMFAEPFFAICAYRLREGGLVSPTPPVLMIPDSAPPAVGGSADFDADTMHMEVAAAACSLQWRMRLPERLDRFPEIVSLDILVSDPIPLYDHKGTLYSARHVTTDAFTHSFGSDGSCREHPVFSGTFAQAWKPEPYSETEIAAAICRAADFHTICEIPAGEATSSAEFSDVPLNCGGLELAAAFGTVRPDYLHLSSPRADSSSLISGRLTLSGITLTRPLPLPLAQAAPYSSDPSAAPRWIFHPDETATVYPYEAGGETRGVRLRPHPLLRGSFFWRGMTGDDASFPATPESSLPEARTVRIPAAVWRSSKYSPLHFPDPLFMRLDVKRVIAVCRAFRASGLVAATAPTAYAFTSEGVFLLRESDDATFRDAGLICTHVLRDPASLRAEGRRVAFTAAGGETVIIEGTSVRTAGNSGAPGSGSGAGSSSPSAIVALTPEDPGQECGFTTRPLKLGDPEEWKRVEGVALRGNFDPADLHISIYGSATLRAWRKIAECDGASVGGLWAPFARYLKIEAAAMLAEGDTIEGIAVRIY